MSDLQKTHTVANSAEAVPLQDKNPSGLGRAAAQTRFDFRQMPPFRMRQAEDQIETYAEAALTTAKLEGQWLAVRARWISLAAVAFMLPFLNPQWSVLYYHGSLILFALIGYLQLRFARLGSSRAELALIFCDLVLLTLVTVVPNPLDKAAEWPLQSQYVFGGFQFFYVILASATLAYSWRTIVAVGTWTAVVWMSGVLVVWFWPVANPELSTAIANILADFRGLAYFFDPNSVNFGLRVQEVVVFFLVAGTLAVTVRRSSLLLRSHAAAERARTNLARYFSPNVVEQLSQNDDPLKDVRMQDVAVMFVDIVGFTRLSNHQSPQAVIDLLRDFHGAMGRAVFDHSGTLDKYLGDGLMATFGTPFQGERDVANAVECAFDMVERVETLNATRRSAGQAPISLSIGLHYGSVVLGDIGGSRLEFAVVGDTVNIASRVEALTRSLSCHIALSDAVRNAIQTQGVSPDVLDALTSAGALALRGVDQPMVVWTALPKVVSKT
ncbi:MAG: adenylate/guanylate cyclase domain-containing protein [Pseudomonadota bacterium]